MSSQGFATSSQSSYGAVANRSGSSFEEQSKSISTLLFKLNNNASSLERTVKKVGTADDGPLLRTKLHNIQKETNQLVHEITDSLRHLGSIVGRGDRQQRLQVERLKESFKKAVERYSSVQKRVTDQVKSDELKIHSRKNTFSEEPEAWSDDAKLLEQEQRREQLLQQQIEAEDDYAWARDREERVKQLESDILDVNEIFKELGTMVYDQGETIDTIEENIVRASDNVNAGNEQLTTAVKYQKSYRKKLCILAIILVIVAAVVAVILGVTLSKH